LLKVPEMMSILITNWKQGGLVVVVRTGQQLELPFTLPQTCLRMTMVFGIQQSQELHYVSLAILTSFWESLGVLRQQMQSKTRLFHLGMYVIFQHTCSNFGPYFLILKSLVQLKSRNISTPNDWTKDLSWNNKLLLDVLSWVLHNKIGPDSKEHNIFCIDCHLQQVFHESFHL